jgi:hypothetical protein
LLVISTASNMYGTNIKQSPYIPGNVQFRDLLILSPQLPVSSDVQMMSISRICNEVMFIPVMFYSHVYSRDLDSENVSTTYKFSYLCKPTLEITMSHVQALERLY